MCCSNIGKCIILIITIPLILSQLAAIIAPFWTVEEGEQKTNVGLFQFCANKCQNLYNVPDWLKAVRGLLFIGVGISLAAFILLTLLLTCLTMCIPDIVQKVLFTIVYVCGAASILIAVAMFAARRKDKIGPGSSEIWYPGKLHACFGLSCINSAACVACLILTCIFI